MNALLRARLLRKPVVPAGYLSRRDVTVRSGLKRAVIATYCQGWLPKWLTSCLFFVFRLRGV